MNTQTATIIPTSYYFIYNGETLPGFIEGDYAYAERRREGLAKFCGVYPWEIEIKKR